MIYEKLEKLKTLAERGVGGEKDNAQKMLERLCERMGIATNEVSGAIKSVKYFSYKTSWEKTLVTYVVGKVTDTWPPEISRWKPIGKGKRTKIGFELTNAEAAEVHLQYDIYLDALKDAHHDFFVAFLSKNQIFPETTPAPEPPTDAPAKLNPFMDGMKKTHVRRRLIQSPNQ